MGYLIKIINPIIFFKSMDFNTKNRPIPQKIVKILDFKILGVSRLCPQVEQCARSSVDKRILPQTFWQANKSRLYVFAIFYEYHKDQMYHSVTFIRVKGGCFVLFPKCTNFSKVYRLSVQIGTNFQKIPNSVRNTDNRNQ